MKEELDEAGVDTEYIKIVEIPTGNAIIKKKKKGNNCIILYAGANHRIRINCILFKRRSCSNNFKNRTGFIAVADKEVSPL